MKILSTFFITCLFYFNASSQVLKFTTDYSLGFPQQQMAHNIQAIHSIHIGGLYQLPGRLEKLSIGLELGAGIYAYKKIDQTFNFDANTSTVVPVNYSSNVGNFSLQSKYQLLDEKRAMIVPYVSARAGLYSFFSDLTIEDPDDPLGCHPLDKKKLINDKTLYWGAGAGFQINPSVFTKKHKKDGSVMIDISINTINGDKLDYINTKHLKDDQDMSQMDGKPLLMKFINVSTQDIHEHTVAQVYTSALRILEIRGGVIVKLGKP
jgi:hypothetical protein